MGTSWTYDAGDRLTTVSHNQGATVLFSATATYDNVGRRLSQTDYDPARVTGSLPSGTPNLLAPSRILGTPTPGSVNALPSNRISGTPVPGSPNQLASRGGGLPATTVQTLQYDAAGRLTYETRTGVADTYWTYDAAGNRTGQYTGPQSITYSYDE